MKQVDPRALLDATLESPVGTIRARAVLPFFTKALRTKFLLIVPIEGRVLLTHDLPTGVVSRVLAYPREPRRRAIDKIAWSRLWHFDPWWLMREREGVPKNIRKAIVATNLAGKLVADGPLEHFWFEDGLAGVASAVVGGNRLPLRRLQPLMDAGPTEPVQA